MKLVFFGMHSQHQVSTKNLSLVHSLLSEGDPVTATKNKHGQNLSDFMYCM